jgi:hypothetical protein
MRLSPVLWVFGALVACSCVASAADLKFAGVMILVYAGRRLCGGAPKEGEMITSGALPAVNGR